MKKQKNILIYSALLLLFLVNTLFATAKTLPKGVWKFDAYYSSHEFVKGGVNPSGDLKTYEVRDVDSLTMGDFPLFQGLALQIPGIDLTTRVIDKWERNRTHLDIAYGLSKNLTAFINVTHERAFADYTPEYTQQTTAINAALEAAGQASPVALAQANAFNAAPDKATSNHLRDTFVGMKYAISPKLALTYRFTAGALKTGNDSTEKQTGDGVQELETSGGYDIFQFLIDYDITSMRLPVHLTAGYIVNGEGTQSFLDNSDVKVEYGDMIYLKAATIYPLSSKWLLDANMEHFIIGSDKYSANSLTSTFGGTAAPSTPTTVPNSAGYMTLGSVGIRYMPKQFWHIFLKLTKPLRNQTEGGVYEFPGRLEPGLKVDFGMTLFYK